jgi:hypothetical protein
MPVSKSAKIGVWEDSEFVGAVIFALGANMNMATPFGLTPTECCELVRVALRSHKTQVSRILAIAVKLLKRQSPGLRLVVSYADKGEGHHGGIYQGAGWLFSGDTKPCVGLEINGKKLHKRAFSGRQFGKPRKSVPIGAKKIRTSVKHRYLMPLDPEMRKRIEPLAKPYPKRAGSIESDAVAIPGDVGRCKSDLGASQEQSNG